jgi:excisionase family DNA binding protein
MGKKLRLDQVADELQMSKRAVRRLVSQGLLRAYRIGQNVIRVDSDDITSVLKPVTPSGND